MKNQFFGKGTVWWILGSSAIYGLAALSWWQSVLALPLLMLILVSMAFATQRSLVLGFSILFAELVIGGHGLLLHANVGPIVLTLRHVIFVGFFAGYGVLLLRQLERLRPFYALTALLSFVLWLTIECVVGGLQNGWVSSFDEYNSFFYFALLIPIFGHNWVHTEKRQVLVAVFGALVFLASVTLLFGYAYGHFPGKVMHVPYVAYRDARVTEVSLQVIQDPPAGKLQAFMLPWLEGYPYWYRIFNPSQVFLLIGLCLYAAYAFLHGVDRSVQKHWIALVAIFAGGLFVGMSRSIALGLILALMLTFAFLLFSHRLVGISKISRAVGAAAVGVFFAGLAFVLVAALPVPTRPDLRDAAFYATSAGTTRQAAVTSRWSLLQPLHESIAKSPLVGYGFGKTLTYKSADPRIISETGGAYTTYRFEWGYQDLMLKLGLVGVFLYLFLLYQLFGHAFLKWRGLSWLHVGFLSSILALGITHIFTPYLNHPLGIGILLLAAIVIGQPVLKKDTVQEKEGNVLMTFPSVSPVSVAMEDRG